jgi:hypothetical protein
MLVGIAVAHVLVGLVGVACGLVGWYFFQPGSLLPVIAGCAALVAALAGAVALELARFSQPRVALGAQLLLVSADLIAIGSLTWLLGPTSFVSLFCLLPVVLSALFFSRRAVMVVPTITIGGFIAICIARAGFAFAGWLPLPVTPAVWLPEAGVLAIASALFAYCCGQVSERAVIGFALAFQRIDRLATQRSALRAEQQRLIESTRALEDAHRRLTQERALVNRQVMEIVRVVERLGEGDTNALRALHPGMYGPLMTLSSGLTHLGQRLAMLQGQQYQTSAQQRALDALASSTREQAQLLSLTDNALRELSASANELVAEVQRIERGSGERAGADRRVLFQALREIEQHMLTQASDTAMLGARLAQLRARQTEIESSVRYIARTNTAQHLGPVEIGEMPQEHEAAPAGDPGIGSTGAPPHFAGVAAGQRADAQWAASGMRSNWLT